MMGYSFATPCKSEKARSAMMAFLETHYRPWSDIVAPLENRITEGRGLMPFASLDTRARGPATDLAYDRGTKIGFDYGAGFSDAERCWMYNFCYWMAQRVGRRRPFTKKAPGCGAVPYVVYDGYEAWPVLEASEYGDKVPDSEWLVHNGFRGMSDMLRAEKEAAIEVWAERGEKMPPQNENWYAKRLEGAALVDEVLRDELDRLSKLWETQREE